LDNQSFFSQTDEELVAEFKLFEAAPTITLQRILLCVLDGNREDFGSRENCVNRVKKEYKKHRNLKSALYSELLFLQLINFGFTNASFFRTPRTRASLFTVFEAWSFLGFGTLSASVLQHLLGQERPIVSEVRRQVGEEALHCSAPVRTVPSATHTVATTHNTTATTISQNT